MSRRLFPGHETPSGSVIASDQRERGNLSAVVLEDCEIALASPRNDRGGFLADTMLGQRGLALRQGPAQQRPSALRQPAFLLQVPVSAL